MTGRLRRMRGPLVGAVGSGVAITVVGVLALQPSRFADWDAEAFRGFWMMQRPTLAQVEQTVVHTVNARPFVGIALAITAVALIRRRSRLLPAIALTLAGANLSTQLLKHLVPVHGTLVPASPIITGPSFPSGHATACMSLVLCAVLAAPPRIRPVIAAVGTLYALAVGYSVVVLATHFPSDVIGGFLMATLWTMLALVAFPGAGSSRRSEPVRPAWSTVTPLAWVGSLGVAAIGVGIATGPAQITPVPLAVTSALIALVAVAAVGGVAELSLQLDALRAGGRRA